jgi:hypothetical protein
MRGKIKYKNEKNDNITVLNQRRNSYIAPILIQKFSMGSSCIQNLGLLIFIKLASHGKRGPSGSDLACGGGG